MPHLRRVQGLSRFVVRFLSISEQLKRSRVRFSFKGRHEHSGTNVATHYGKRELAIRVTRWYQVVLNAADTWLKGLIFGAVLVTR